MPKSYLDLLKSNKKWANTVQTYNPTFFDELSQGQHPNYLWIGCADSCVPASFLNEEWDKEKFLYIHGWVYSLKDGILKDLNVTTNTVEGLESIFQFSTKTNEIF
jgi:carbonic anhydrase